MNLYPVSISLGSYGADFVRDQGQASLIPLLTAAGVSHIELREELFSAPADVPGLRGAIRAAGLACVYSAPIELWLPDAREPNPDVARALSVAVSLQAVWLKVSLGHFNDRCDFAALARMIAEQPVRLLVENDQTPQGGKLAPLVQFFAKVRGAHLPIGMTFDIGNWQWQGESVADAARLLSREVDYLHCKAVERRGDKLCAIPPQAADLQQWDALLHGMRPGIVRAVEYPLQGADLQHVTQAHVATLARLGQPQQEQAHG